MFLVIFIGKRVRDFLPSFYMKLEMQEGLGWSFFKRENLGCHKKQFTSFFLFCAVHFLGRRRKKVGDHTCSYVTAVAFKQKSMKSLVTWKNNRTSIFDGKGTRE